MKKIAIIVLMLGLGAVSVAAPSRADTLTVAQITRADFCPVTDANPVPAPSYGKAYYFPHLTTVADAYGNPFNSVFIADNINPNSADLVTVCAFSTTGTFYGGSVITMPAMTRLMVTTSTTRGDGAFSRILLPPRTVISSGPGAGAGTGLPSNATFTLVVGTLNFGFTRTQAGFVGTNGYIYAMYGPGSTVVTPTIGSDFPHIGAGGMFDSLIYIMNPSFVYNASVRFFLYNAAGTAVYDSGDLTIAQLQRTVIDLGAAGVNQFGYGILYACPSGATACTNTRFSAVQALTTSLTALPGPTVQMIVPRIQSPQDNTVSVFWP